MIARIASRDSDVCAMVFARGSYEFGLLDAGIAGAATLVISADASGMSSTVVKPGSLVHIFPQYDFGHWYGLITGEPLYNASQRVFTVQALELHGFLPDIQAVVSFAPATGSPAADPRS